MYTFYYSLGGFRVGGSAVSGYNLAKKKSSARPFARHPFKLGMCSADMCPLSVYCFSSRENSISSSISQISPPAERSRTQQNS